MFEQICRLIQDHSRIIIHRHKNPDGDALGSQLGLAYMLKDTFPQKEIYAVGDMTPRYAFMAEEGMDEIPDALYGEALAIVLDTSAASLISDERYRTASATARIDHHVFLETICHTEVTDTSFESCCGMIAALVMEAGYTVSPKAAQVLYTGMVTDSGRFRYDSTSPRTHRLAAFLLERGFDPTAVYRQLYRDELSSVQLRASFTLNIQTTPHRVAYIYTTKEALAACGADVFTVSRGMVGTMSELRGIDTWANFTETEEGVLCELRSSLYNVGEIAVKYGGGGHKKASGCTLRDRQQAMELLEELNQLAKETDL